MAKQRTEKGFPPQGTGKFPILDPRVTTEVSISYYANGKLYIAVKKDDTIRFYYLSESSSEIDSEWIPTDIYLNANIATVEL